MRSRNTRLTAADRRLLETARRIAARPWGRRLFDLLAQVPIGHRLLGYCGGAEVGARICTMPRDLLDSAMARVEAELQRERSTTEPCA